MSPSLRIGLDLDGVIIDHGPHKLALARELGYDLEPWQVNSNVMGQFVPDDDRRAIKERLYGSLTPDAPPIEGALEHLASLPGELYIVSARRIASVRYAQEWMMRHGLFEFIPAERIFFCTSKYEKRGHCERLGISIFIDDQIKVLRNLPLTVRCVLFDEHRVADKITVDQHVEVAADWQDVLTIARRSLRRPGAEGMA